MTKASNRWRALAVICAAMVLSLTTWFSATAVTPELAAAWNLSGAMLAWLTNGVQLGFVIGALASSLVNLPDIVRLNRLMAAAATIAALANASLLLEPGPAGMIAARMATGAALAGIYPPALKLIATWFVKGRGLAMGAVIGALTLGSAMPHLFRAILGTFDWRVVLGTASGATLVGALILLTMAREGPYPFGRAVFDPRRIGMVVRDRALVLATLGYLGHMWELYAMWAWLLVFLAAAPAMQGTGLASWITFAAIGSGAIGCVAGGQLADRFGRTAVTAALMAASGACALLIGFAFDGPLWLLILIAVVWGITVVGDSAQFSAAATELADPRYVGTVLSVQLGLGFLLTVGTVGVMPYLADAMGGWRWAFAPLAIGPVIGVAAMLALRARPEAMKLAGGRR
ncbi:MAG: MFS family permease [Paracoccaceae bacterium]|jgi:MFS family permease